MPCLRVILVVFFLLIASVWGEMMGYAQEMASEENGSGVSGEPLKKSRSPRRSKYYFSASLLGNFHFDSFIDHLGVHDDYTNILGGMTFSLRAGFLQRGTSWGIEQQLGLMTGMRMESGSRKLVRWDAATFVDVNQELSGIRKTKAIFTYGIGFLYNMRQSGDCQAFGDSLAVDRHGTMLSVGMKLGLSWFWTPVPQMAFGVELRYIIGYDIGSWLRSQFSEEFSEEDRKRDAMIVQLIQPGIVWMMQF